MRFQKILDAAQRSGVDELILLGDGLPAPDWLSYPTSGAHYALSPTGTQGAVHDFSKLRDDDTRLPPGSCSKAETLRGYAEQVCVYAALYRNPSATVHVNMRCIVTNKSGGPDLPSLAGIPQIQIAEMSGTENIVFHRMGFQALCSHAWTVLRSPARASGDVMTLTTTQVNELTDPLRRAQRLRKWHLDQLGGKRFTWT